MNCDLCGKESELSDAIIEGSRVSVCKNCSKFGKTIYLKKPNLYYENKPKKSLIIKKPEIIEIVVSNYAQLIKQGRESLKLNQKKLAKMIGVKESLLNKIESAHIKPSILLAKKFQKFFNIKFIETYEEEEKTREINLNKTSLTIGDLINLK
jgi:putative transcription factor